MSKERRGKLIRYGVTAAVGLLIAAVVMYSQGFGAETDTARRVLILSDAFTAPGLLLILAAGLVFVSNHGSFNGIGYVLNRALAAFIPSAALSRKYESYKDYVAQKGEKSKTFGYLLITGGVFLAVGVIFTAVYYGAFH